MIIGCGLLINVNFPADAATVRTVGCCADKGRVKKGRSMFHKTPPKENGSGRK